MRKILRFSIVFSPVILLLWLMPNLSLAVSAPDALAIAKSDGITQVIAGDGILHRYTITITNQGPTTAIRTVVTDTWPVGFLRSAVIPSRGSCDTTGPNNFTCSLGNISAGSLATISASYTVPADAQPGVYTNHVQSASSNNPVVTANDSNTVLTVNLGIAKSDNLSQVTAGDGVTHRYAITVINSGPSPASSVLVTDTWPLGLSRSAVNSSQGSCDTTKPNNFTCSLGSISVDRHATITATYTVPSTTAPGIYTNQAFAHAPDSALVTASDATTVSASANLAITKSDGVTSVTAGDGVVRSYIITLNNPGPSLASSVMVTDTWPVGFTRGSVSRSQGTCNTTNPNNFTCSLGAIPAGNQATITASYTVPATTSPGMYTNQAQAKSPASVLITATDVNAVSASANLRILKSDGLSQVTAGDGITHHYAITVTNSGPSLASSVIVTDTWPVGFTRGVVSKSQGACNTTNPTNFTCALGAILVGSRATITATYTVPPTTPLGTSTNNVQTKSTTTDPVGGNNTASDQTTVGTLADMSLSMSDTPDPVLSGSYLTYTLNTTNPGPSRAMGVTISDNLPPPLTFISSGSSPACVVNSGIVTCSLGNLSPGENRQVVIRTLVSPSYSGTVTNAAQVTSSTSDLNLTNNHAEVQTLVLVPDEIPPTVSWVQPVQNDGLFYVGCQTVHLEVTATDNVAVQRVVFAWWDPIRVNYRDIGTDYTAPYSWDFFTDPIYLNDQNQIFAWAYDLIGNQSLYPYPRIRLSKTVNCKHVNAPIIIR